MALTQLNLDIELREISLKNRPKQLLEISPKGTVPVLFINHNIIIEESLEIMIWAINHSKSNLFNLKKEKQLKFIVDHDNNFKYWLDRYKYNERYPEESFEYYQNKCKDYLLIYDKRLEKNEFLFGDRSQLADIAIFPFIRQCANVNLNWFQSNFIHLNKWLHEFIHSVLFTSIMNKYEIWDKKSTNYIINFKI